MMLNYLIWTFNFFFILMLLDWRFLIRREIKIHIVLTLWVWELRNWKTLALEQCLCLLINVFIDVTLWMFFFNSGKILLCVTPNLSSRSWTNMSLNFLPILLVQTHCYFRIINDLDLTFNEFFMLVPWPSSCHLWVLLSESLLIRFNLSLRQIFAKVELLPSCSPFIQLIFQALPHARLIIWFILSLFLFFTVIIVWINFPAFRILIANLSC